MLYGSWTFDNGTTAGTGNATLAASDGVTFADGAATIPVNEKLSTTTNAGGDLTTYTFMMDVKVLNENSLTTNSCCPLARVYIL
jgi:hypothetical protein